MRGRRACAGALATAALFVGEGGLMLSLLEAAFAYIEVGSWEPILKT
jgi:hypothetical protein